MSRQNFRSNREDFGAETKIFPAVSGSAGKIALAGVRERGAAMIREDASW